MLNHCTFIGHLGNDPEIKTVGDTKVANFSIGCTERWKDKNGERKERTEWVRCAAWGPLAGIIETYLRKGAKVYVAGKMETRSWDDNGVKKYATEIRVSDMKMLDSKQQSEPQNNAAQAQAPAPDELDDEIPF